MAKFLDENGNEVEGFTKEEVDAIAKERDEAIAKAAEADEHLKIKTGEFVLAQKKFKRTEELTAEEKQKMGAEALALQQRIQDQEDLRKKDLEDSRSAIFEALAGKDPKIKEKLVEKYGLIQLPEGSVAEVRLRASQAMNWALSELGIQERVQPIEDVINTALGVPPRTKSSDETKNFAETEGGKKAEKELFGNILPAEGNK